MIGHNDPPTLCFIEEIKKEKTVAYGNISLKGAPAIYGTEGALILKAVQGV